MVAFDAKFCLGIYGCMWRQHTRRFSHRKCGKRSDCCAANSAPTQIPATETPNETEFPLPDDATNVNVAADGIVTFQTALSMPDVVTFYRFAFPDYTEREDLTVFGDTFKLVFDGHESGKAVIVQGFILNEQGVVSVSIQLGDA